MGEPAPTLVVVMGVSGSGKSTLGSALAARLDWPFLDADDYHPQENIQHMGSGHALTDAMREPWVCNIENALRVYSTEARSCVLAFSGLRLAHRERLRALDFQHFFIHLHASSRLIAQRMSGRQGHFMPAQLLASQQEALEMPGAAEQVFALDVAAPPERLANSMADAVSCFLLG